MRGMLTSSIENFLYIIQFWKCAFDLGVFTLRSGERSIRFRPALDITPEVVDEAINLLVEQGRRM